MDGNHRFSGEKTSAAVEWKSSLSKLTAVLLAILMVTSMMAPAVAASTPSQPDNGESVANSDMSTSTSPGSISELPGQVASGGDTQDAAQTGPKGEPEHTITLVTGQTVRIYNGSDGDREIVSDADETLHYVHASSGTYVFPDGVDLSVYDRSLFNVDLLIEEELTDAETGEIPVILRATETRDGKAVGAAEAGSFNDISGMKNARTLGLIRANAAAFEKERAGVALSRIDRDPNLDLDRVYLDRSVKVSLDSSTEAIAGDQARKQYDVNGSNVSVAVLDTGIDADHPDLTNAVVAQKDFSGDGVGDRSGHGTHVAGTIAGDGSASNGSYVGVAPGASIVDVKVLGDDGSGSVSTVVEGIGYAVDQDVDVISMSLGAPSSPDDPTVAAVNNATAAGVTVISAAGNTGPDRETVGAPAIAESGIAVGATNHETDALAEFSARGPTATRGLVKPDVVAPGVEIAAARADGTYAPIESNDQYASLSGTSMATPHVSGVAALMLEGNPDMTPLQAKNALLSTSDGPVGTDNTDVYSQGAGQVNASTAITQNIVLRNATESFGIVSGNETLDRVVTVENTGSNTTELHIEQTLTAVTDGESHADRLSVNETNVTVAPGETANVRYTIDTAGEGGVYSGSLQFVTNGSADTYRSIFGYTLGERVVVEKQAYSENGAVEGDVVWADSGTHDVEMTIENGQTSFIAVDEEYSIFSSGFDEPTHQVVKTFQSVNVTRTTSVMLNETETVGYSIDDSQLNNSLRSMQLNVKAQWGDNYGTDWRTRYDNQNITTVRFSQTEKLNVSVNHLAVPVNQHDSGRNVDVTDIYWLVYSTVGVDGPESFVVNETELGTIERTYYRSVGGAPISSFFSSYTSAWSDSGASSSGWGVGNQVTQTLHVTQDGLYRPSLIVSDGTLRTPSVISPEPGETVKTESNRHPYTAGIDHISVDDTHLDVEGKFMMTQDRTERTFGAWDYDGAYAVRVNDELIDTDTAARRFDSQNNIDLTDNDNIEITLEGQNPEGYLSTEVNTELSISYDSSGENTPPLLRSTNVEGIDEINSVDPGNVTIEFVVDSSDGLNESELVLLTATEDVADAPWTDDNTLNPNGTWNEHTIDSVDPVENEGERYRVRSTVDTSNYEGTLHLATQFVDTGGDRYESITRDAFNVGTPHIDDPGDNETVISGQLLMADGEPAADHTVYLSQRDGEWAHATPLTNETGHFSAVVDDEHIYDMAYTQWSRGRDPGVTTPRDGNVDLSVIGTVDLSDGEQATTAVEPSSDSVTAHDAGAVTNGDADLSLTSDGSSGSLQFNTTDPNIGTIELNAGHPVTVEVVDEDNNSVEGAQVEYSDVPPAGQRYTILFASTETDGLAYFADSEREGLELNGTTEIRVSPPENSKYVDTQYTFNKNVTSEEHIRVTLEEGATLSGGVIDANGQPAENDTVDVFTPETEQFTTARTDSNGRFTAQVKNGTDSSLGYYNQENGVFTSTKDGSPDLYTLGSVVVNDETDIGNRTLPDANRLDITVVDESNTSIEDAQVRVVHTRNEQNGTIGFGTGSQTTNAQGEYQLAGAAEPGIEVTGNITVQVDQPDSEDIFDDPAREFDLTVTEDEHRIVTLGSNESSGNVTISGAAVDVDGDPVANKSILVTASNGSVHTDEFVYTNETGAFTASVPENTEVALGLFGGRQGAERDGIPDVFYLDSFEVGTADLQRNEYQLPEGQVIDANVTDEDGSPVENASVHIRAYEGDVDSFGTAHTTNADGYLDIGSVNGTGIELAQNVSITVEPPANDDRFENNTYEKRFTVNGSEEVQFTLTEQSESDPGVTNLSVVPQRNEVTAGENVTVDVDIDTPANVTAVDTVVTVDPERFNVVDAEFGPFLTSDETDTKTVGPNINNTVGEINTAESRQDSSGITGNGSVVTLTLQATENVDSDVESEITLVTADVIDTNNDSVPIQRSDATVTVTPKPLTIDAAVDDTVNANQEANISVSVGNATPNTTVDLKGVDDYEHRETNNGQVFTVRFNESTWTGGENGTYEQTAIELVASDGNRSANTSVETSVREPGDVSGDGAVALLDLRLLALAYGSDEGTTNYNADADLTNDGEVGLDDHTLLSQQWRSTAWDGENSTNALDATPPTIETISESPAGIQGGEL